jgi:hypothetical protein
MRGPARIILGFALAAPGLLLSGTAAAQANVAHTHIGHVAERFGDTPANRGLLATAVAEATVAVDHAALAAQDPTNLANIKLHAGHVIHAIDPTQIGTGPGLGYGVKKAANATIVHTEMAAAVPGVSAAVRVLSNHIVVSTKNSLPLADRAIAIAKEIQASTDAEAATALVADLQKVTAQMASGMDADENGDVTFREGGLRQAEQRANLLRRAEGIGGGN